VDTLKLQEESVMRALTIWLGELGIPMRVKRRKGRGDVGHVVGLGRNSREETDTR